MHSEHTARGLIGLSSAIMVGGGAALLLMVFTGYAQVGVFWGLVSGLILLVGGLWMLFEMLVDKCADVFGRAAEKVQAELDRRDRKQSEEISSEFHEEELIVLDDPHRD